MSSCLSSRTCGFNLEHMIKWPCSSRTPSNPSSPSSTLSESSNSQTTISTHKTRTPRKRPNQTYNEAAALLSIASPNIFKIKHLTRRTTNNLRQPKFTKHHGNFFNEPPELITEDAGFHLRRRFTNNPCFSPDLKVTNSGRVSREIESGCVSSEVSDGCLDEFDTGSILNEGIEQGIDSIMGDCKLIPENHELNACYGYPIGLGFGVRNGVRALKNADERNWWNFPMVDVVNSSPAAVVKCEKAPVGKKKRVEEFRQGSFGSGDRNVSVGKGKRLVLKLDYDGVLNEWGDKQSPVPEEISHASSPGVGIDAKAANIDLFSEDGSRKESTATLCIDKISPKKIRAVKNTGIDKQSRCKGRFVKKPNSSDCDEVTH